MPASSAAATNESPFHAADSAVASTSNGTTTAFGASSRIAAAANTTVVARPIRRSGTIREPITSDQRPAPIRKNIAIACDTASTPAAPAAV